MEETGIRPILTYRREDEYFLGEVSDAEDMMGQSYDDLFSLLTRPLLLHAP